MKKVIRLTESDLMRIVKRVIKEQSNWTFGSEKIEYSNESCYRNTPSNYKPIIKMIDQATNGFDEDLLSNWDEDKLRDAILMIKSAQDYRAINKLLICFATAQLHDPSEGIDPDYSRDLIKNFYIVRAFGNETSIIPSESNNKNIILKKLKKLGV